MFYYLIKILTEGIVEVSQDFGGTSFLGTGVKTQGLKSFVASVEILNI